MCNSELEIHAPAIRECVDGDFDGVVLLLRQLLVGKDLNVASLRIVWERGMSSDAQIYICAGEQDSVIGFASLSLVNTLWQEGFLAHVDELVVAHAYRGRGVGTQLLEKAIGLARARGCKLIQLESAVHRKEAHLFYERRGFRLREAVGYSKAI